MEHVLHKIYPGQRWSGSKWWRVFSHSKIDFTNKPLFFIQKTNGVPSIRCKTHAQNVFIIIFLMGVEQMRLALEKEYSWETFMTIGLAHLKYESHCDCGLVFQASTLFVTFNYLLLLMSSIHYPHHYLLQWFQLPLCLRKSSKNEFCKNFKNTLFYRTPLVVASGLP